MDCLREGGSTALTVRAVAARLETGPSSLYAHIRDQDELRVLIVDEVAASALQEPLAVDDEGALALLRAYAAALYGVPGAADLALRTTPTGPSSLDLAERLLEALSAGGRELAVCLRALDFMVLLVTASVAEHDSRRAQPRNIGDDFADALAFDERPRPLLLAALSVEVDATGPDHLRWALRALLTGADGAAPRRRRTPLRKDRA